jgi:hypothetical protein
MQIACLYKTGHSLSPRLQHVRRKVESNADAMAGLNHVMAKCRGMAAGVAFINLAKRSEESDGTIIVSHRSDHTCQASSKPSELIQGGLDMSKSSARDQKGEIRDRYNSLFDGDFMPWIRQEQIQGAAERTAYAEEFAAYNLGQINKKLGRLIEIMQ